jgi:hypothetical protein
VGTAFRKLTLFWGLGAMPAPVFLLDMSQENTTPPLRVGQGMFRVTGLFAIVDDQLKPYGDVPIVDTQSGKLAELIIPGLDPADWEKARLRAAAMRDWHQAQVDQTAGQGETDEPGSAPTPSDTPAKAEDA